MKTRVRRYSAFIKEDHSLGTESAEITIMFIKLTENQTDGNLGTHCLLSDDDLASMANVSEPLDVWKTDN